MRIIIFFKRISTFNSFVKLKCPLDRENINTRLNSCYRYLLTKYWRNCCFAFTASTCV